MAERRLIFSSLLLFSILTSFLRTRVAADVPRNAREVVLSTETCFGASGNDFGFFDLPSKSSVTSHVSSSSYPGIPIVAFRISALSRVWSDGVTCATSSHRKTPLQCKEFYNIGIACGNNTVSPQFTPANRSANTTSDEGRAPITAKNLHQLIAVNQTGASDDPDSVWLTSVNTVLPVGSQCAVVYLTDFYDNEALEATSTGSSCVSVSAFVAGQADAGLASSSNIVSTIASLDTGAHISVVVDSSCLDAQSEFLCESRAFCGWAPHSSTCCPIRSALNSSTEDPRCTCPRVDPLLRLTSTTVHNPTCNIDESAFFTRNLIARYCQQTSTSSTAATSSDISICINEFQRCILPPRASSPLRPYVKPLASLTYSSVITTTPPTTHSSLVDLALSYQCQSSSWNVCADPTQACAEVETVLTPSPFAINFTQVPTTNDGVASVFVNKQYLALEEIHEGTAELMFSLRSINWNQTLFQESIELVRDAFSPLTTGVKYGWSRDVIHVNSSFFISPTDVVIRLGPSPSFRPEALEFRMQFQATASMFESSGNIGGATAVEFVVRREPLDWRLTNFTNIVSVATAYGTLLSGASGWIGLATLQTNMMMAHTDCAELNSKLMFPNAKFIVTPWRYVEDSHRLVFLVGLGLVLFFILCHLAGVGLYKIVVRPRIIAEALRATWNPYMVLYTCPVTLVGMTQTAWTGMIDDQTAYVRVLFGLTDGIYFVLLLLGWDYCRRKGFEGYYALYSTTSRLDNENEEKSQSVNDSRRKKSGEEGDREVNHDENKHHQEDARKAAVNAGQNVFKARWQEIKMAYGTGQLSAFCRSGILHWFKPRGHWPNARGYTALREQCHETGCAFPIVVLLFLFLAGANASHFSNEKNFCYAIYWNYTILSLVYFVLFAFFTPFRTPILNLLWAISHILEIATYATSARWVIVDDPSQHDGSRIAPLAFSAVLVQAAFNLHVLLTTLVERFIYLSEWCKIYGDTEASVQGSSTKDHGNLSGQNQLPSIKTDIPIHQAIGEAEAARIRSRLGAGTAGSLSGHRFRPTANNPSEHSFPTHLNRASSGLRQRQSSLSPVLVASQVADDSTNEVHRISHGRSVLAPLSGGSSQLLYRSPSARSSIPRRPLTPRNQLEAVYSPEGGSPSPEAFAHESNSSRTGITPRYNPLRFEEDTQGGMRTPAVPIQDPGSARGNRTNKQSVSYRGPTTVSLGPISSPPPGSDHASRNPELGGGHLLTMVHMFGATRVRAPKPRLEVEQASPLNAHLHELDEDALTLEQRQEKAAVKALRKEQNVQRHGADDEDTVDLSIDFDTYDGAMEAVDSIHNRVFYGRRVTCTVIGPHQAVKQFRQALL